MGQDADQARGRVDLFFKKWKRGKKARDVDNRVEKVRAWASLRVRVDPPPKRSDSFFFHFETLLTCSTFRGGPPLRVLESFPCQEEASASEERCSTTLFFEFENEANFFLSISFFIFGFERAVGVTLKIIFRK